MISLWKFARTALLVAPLLVPGLAFAQDYPTRAVTLVVPFPPGGATDIVARAAAEELRKEIGQPVVVENRAGGGTIIGSVYVKNAKPDGYTLLLATNTFYGSALANKNPGYDPFKDFVTLVPLADAPYVLFSPPGIKTLKDLVDFSKSKPGQSRYASLGTAATQMVLAEQMKAPLGLDWIEVPYKGASDAILAVIRGDIQGYFATYSLAMQYANNPEVNIIVSTGTKRSPDLPKIPTFTELGYPDISDSGLFSVAAHADTPKPIVDYLKKHLAAVARAPELLKVLKANALDVYDGTIEQYDAHAVKRQARSHEILMKMGFQPQ